MDYKNKEKPQNQSNISSKNYAVINPPQILEKDIDKKEFTIKNYNNRSELKQNFLDTQLKNISINFGFPSTLNSYNYQNSYDLLENPVFEQKNYFYYDKNFQLFKNKSVSRYGEKKLKNKLQDKSQTQKLNQKRLFSPQHKIITSLKKKKYLNEDGEINKNAKNLNKEKEKDIYELEVINQVLLNEEDSEGKNKKSGKETLSSKSGKESENEWGEIEQNIFEEKKELKDNLLNSVYIEIEKENGDKQLKLVEISKDDNCLNEDPCLKIKYTVEDKICLNCKTPVKNNKLIKNKKSYLNKNNYLNNKNASGINDSSLRRENVSEIWLKESKSSQNVLSSSDTNDKIFFSGSTVPSTQKYAKYSNALNNLNNKNKIDEIKNLNYRFNEEFNESNNKKYNNYTLTKKTINQDKATNLSPNKIMNLKYNRSSYDSNAYKRKKYLIDNKEQISGYIPKKEIKLIQPLSENEEEVVQENKNKNIATVVKKEEQQQIERKNIYEKYKKKQPNEKIEEKEEDIQRINKRTYVRHKNEEEEKDKPDEKTINKTQGQYNFKKFEINKETTKEKEEIKYETNTEKVISSKYISIQTEKKPADEDRNKSVEKYKINLEEQKQKEKERNEMEKQKEKIRKEKEEKERIDKLNKEKQERERIQRIEQEKREKLEKERQLKLEKERIEKEKKQKLEREKQEKLEKEKAERERLIKMEKERQEREKQRKLEKERQDKEKQIKLEKERQERERLERQQKLEKEKQHN